MLNYIPKPKRIPELTVCRECGTATDMISTDGAWGYYCSKCHKLVSVVAQQTRDKLNKD